MDRCLKPATVANRGNKKIFSVQSLDSLRPMSRMAPSDAGWSSLVARRAHNPKVVGSNPAPATSLKTVERTCPSAVFFARDLGSYIAEFSRLGGYAWRILKKTVTRNYGDHGLPFCLRAMLCALHTHRFRRGSNA